MNDTAPQPKAPFTRPGTLLYQSAIENRRERARRRESRARTLFPFLVLALVYIAIMALLRVAELSR